MTTEQKEPRTSRYQERLQRLWPDVSVNRTWNRKNSVGFTTIPRILSLTATIADQLAGKNKRVSSTYIGLWCRMWESPVVEIENEYEMATEVGFTGTRRIYTWQDRIKLLAKLNFIDVKAGSKGRYQYILIFNPYQVLYDHHRTQSIREQYWLALTERADEIGSKDIQEYELFVSRDNENSA